MYCWLNGTLVPIATALVSVQDRGFMYGDALFETLRFAGAHLLRFGAHWQRLQTAAEQLRFQLPYDGEAIAGACTALLGANAASAHTQGVLRLQLTRGRGTRGPNPTGARDPVFLITQSELPPALEARRMRGYTIVASHWQKPAPTMLPNGAKTANYLNSVLAFDDALAAGADEALLLGATGEVAECSHSNLFLVIDEVLVTPHAASGALLGTMRAQVLVVARQLGVPCEERAVSVAELGHSSEVFLTNAVVGVMPVVSFAARAYPTPGPITQRVWQAIKALDGVGAWPSEDLGL
jgi:branched-chain amino acid aminotransferase